MNFNTYAQILTADRQSDSSCGGYNKQKSSCLLTNYPFFVFFCVLCSYLKFIFLRRVIMYNVSVANTFLN